MSEAKIHFELYCTLKEILEEGLSTETFTYTRVEPEHPIKTSKNMVKGQVDLVLFGHRPEYVETPLLVIEVKDLTDDLTRMGGAEVRNAVEQAIEYAIEIDATYACVYDGTYLLAVYPWLDTSIWLGHDLEDIWPEIVSSLDEPGDEPQIIMWRDNISDAEDLKRTLQNLTPKTGGLSTPPNPEPPGVRAL